MNYSSLYQRYIEVDMISIMSDWKHIFENAPSLMVEAGAYMFRREDPVRAMYFVRSGAIAFERPMADGTSLTLHLALEGMALAEASLFTEFYHCDAVARAPSTIAALPRPSFLAALRNFPETALSFIEAQSKEVQSQRARIEILRLRLVSDKLDAWMDLYGEPAKGDWVKVAEAIGVSQPALYRELAKRRR
jgi:CRP-like cAMP-binding protein